MQVYEYYDGYEQFWEHEEEDDRLKVQYLVVGELNESTLIICYINHNFICPINKRTHDRSWKHITVDLLKAIGYLKNALTNYKEKIPEIRTNIKDAIKNKDRLDRKHNITIPEHTSIGGDGTYTLRLKYGQSYTDKYVEQLHKKIHVLEVVHLCLDDLLRRYSESRHREKRVLRIQRRFRECITDPSHPFCKRRLLREFYGLVE